MGRGVSSGGGQSSLGYLFGGGEAPKPAASKPVATSAPSTAAKESASAAPEKPVSNSAEVRQTPAVPAGGRATNNYPRADGQNTGNFITDRPSTKVHAAPGGGSSLGYLLGGGSN